MTMAPDDHSPIKRSGVSARAPDARRYRAPNPFRVALSAVVDLVALLFGMAMLSLGFLLMFGTDEQLRAWGWWLRRLIHHVYSYVSFYAS